MEVLSSWDMALFRFVNTDISNAVFDAILPFLREKWFWLPFYVFLMSFFWENFKKKGLLIILGIVIAAGLADFTSSSIIKKSVKRLRPCNNLELRSTVQLRVDGCGAGYSFTSSHAANHFAVAFFLLTILGKKPKAIKPALITWASLIAFSQVYVGVHYPFDVICGSILGAIIGTGTAFLFQKYINTSDWGG